MKPVFAFALGAVAVAQAASAQQAAQPVTLKSETFVVKPTTDANGNKKNNLQPTTDVAVLPGDPLVFLLSWKNNTTKPVSGFVINNPIPNSTVYTGARDPQPVVSVDGGKTFGPLATQKVKGADGKLRAANPTDVTGLRWTLAQPIAPGSTGSVAFFALVK